MHYWTYLRLILKEVLEKAYKGGKGQARQSVDAIVLLLIPAAGQTRGVSPLRKGTRVIPEEMAG